MRKTMDVTSSPEVHKCLTSLAFRYKAFHVFLNDIYMQYLSFFIVKETFPGISSYHQALCLDISKTRLSLITFALIFILRLNT